MVLSRRLQRWACLWKVDVVFNVLCLLAVWAFLFKGWSNLQAVGVSTTDAQSALRIGYTLDLVSDPASAAANHVV